MYFYQIGIWSNSLYPPPPPSLLTGQYLALLFHYYVILPYKDRERAKYENILHCSKRIALLHHGLKLLVEQNSKNGREIV